MYSSRQGNSNTARRRDDGLVFPERFIPPYANDCPESLFSTTTGRRGHQDALQYIRLTDPHEFLVFTDGSCLDNGRSDPTGGCAFVWGRARPNSVGGHKSFPLENRGPTGEQHNITSNRAELRAVIAALQFQDWASKGCENLVIAADSKYVVDGITSFTRGWISNGWRGSRGQPVANQDLWEWLLHELARWDARGMSVQFWWIPREWNQEADHYANQAAVNRRD